MRAIVGAATELFADEGYDGVSTRAVAERAGCSETLLFRYFGGKRGLLLAICNQMTERGYERVKAEEFGDLREYLEQQLLQMLRSMRENAAAIRVIAAAIVSDSELAAEFERRHDDEVEYVKEQLGYFQRTGAIAPDVDIRSIASALEQMSFAVGLLVQVVYGKPQAELAALARTVAQVLSAGMRVDVLDGEPWRQEAVQAARDASNDIERLLGLLGGGVPAPARPSRKRS